MQQNDTNDPSKSQQDGGADQKPYNDKVDLNDLDWEDRERVLRLLFSKMNAGVPTSSLKVLSRQHFKSSKAQQV